VSHAHDLTTTQEFVQRVLMRRDVSVATPGESKQNTLATVADNVDRLLKQMTFVINQRQSLYLEKIKCLKLVFISSLGSSSSSFFNLVLFSLKQVVKII